MQDILAYDASFSTKARKTENLKSLFKASVLLMGSMLRIFRRKRNPYEKLADIHRRLYVARIKAEMAWNLRTRRRARQDLFLASVALGAIPLSPRAFSAVYFESCVKDLKKIVKELKKIMKELPEDSEAHGLLAEAISKLEDAQEASDIMTAIQLIREAEQSIALAEATIGSAEPKLSEGIPIIDQQYSP